MRYTRSFIRCDRCGKDFEETDKLVMWMSFQSFNGKREYGDGTKCYHLCLDCEKAFIDWFQGEKRNEHN